MPRRRPTERFDLVEIDIRVYCDVGLAEARLIGAPKSAATIRFRYLNIWRKVDGKWLYAGQQYTRY